MSPSQSHSKGKLLRRFPTGGLPPGIVFPPLCRLAYITPGKAVDRGQGRTGMDDLVFRFVLRRINRDKKKREPQMAPNTCSASCAQYPHLHEHCRPIGLIHVGDGWVCGGGGWRLGLILCHGIFLLDGLIPAVQYSSVRRICPFQFCVDCLKDSGAIVSRSASY